MMSDLNFVVDDPETGPATPVLDLPEGPIGPFVPALSAAYTALTDTRARATVIVKIERMGPLRCIDARRFRANVVIPFPHLCESMVRGQLLISN
jgi:hypothetical protein